MKSVIKLHWPFFLFVVLNIIGVFFHECWRDELQSLLIAKASTSPWDLIAHTTRYEGHPSLWYLLLYFVSFISSHPLAMQILNSVLIISTAALFWWHFPLERKYKALLVFNYFFLFEYGLVARSYTLGIFLMFFYLSFFTSKLRWQRGMSFAALLLLFHTSVYGAIVGISLITYRLLKQKLRFSFSEASVFFINLILAVWQMIPPLDSGFSSGWRLSFDFFLFWGILSNFGRAFLYVPDFKFFPLLWEAIQSEHLLVLWTRSIFFVFILSMTWLVFYRRSRILFGSFFVGSFLLITFSYVKYLGSLRHAAHLIFMMAAFYWLADKEKKWKANSTAQILFVVLGVFSALAGATLYVADLLHPFSDAKHTAQVLEEQQNFQKDFIVAWPDFTGSSVSAYLNGREMFYVNGMRSGTYVKWDKNRFAPPPELKDFESFLIGKGLQSLLFVTSDSQAFEFLSRRFLVKRLYQSSSCIVFDECYQVLRVDIIKGGVKHAL